jgi:hypothetical protein
MSKFPLRLLFAFWVLLVMTSMVQAQVDLPTYVIVAIANSKMNTVGTVGNTGNVYLQWQSPEFSGSGRYSRNMNNIAGTGGKVSFQCFATTETFSSNYSGTAVLTATNGSTELSESFLVMLGASVSGGVSGGTDNMGSGSSANLSPPSLSVYGNAGGGNSQIEYEQLEQGFKTVAIIPAGEEIVVSAGSASGNAYYNGN